MLPPVQAGAYLINKAMLEQLEFDPVGEHASNLGAPLAYRVAEQLSIPAYIYDPVTVDEMIDITRVTGWKIISRFGKPQPQHESRRPALCAGEWARL